MTRTWGQQLFDLDRRMNRARYWLISLLGFLALMVFAVIAAVVLDTFTGRGAGPALALIVAGTPLLLGYFAVIAAATVQRLHDRDKSGKWAWLFLALPYAASFILILLTDARSTPALILVGVLTLLVFAVNVWFFVDCYCLRGTQGPNAYGDDPLDAKSPRASGRNDLAPPQRPSRPPRPSGPPRASRMPDMPEAMTGIVHTLFAFDGRLNRAPYWLWSLVLAGLSFAALFGMAVAFGWISATGIDASRARIPFIIVSLVLLWPTLALIVKRLNDRNRPAWLALPMLLPSWANLLVTKSFGQFRFDTATDSPVEVAVGLLTLVATVYAFIELGCLRGTVGENRHGPDPLEGKGARRQAAPREA